MPNIWSSYKRKQVNISKAVFNDIVGLLLTKNYKYLYSHLVKSDTDKDVFNDTYLRLTYSYNPDIDFIEQFKYYFNLLKGAYYRDDKVANYYVGLDQAADIAVYPDYDLDTPDTNKDKPSITTLKQSLKDYANFKKSEKRADKKG